MGVAGAFTTVDFIVLIVYLLAVLAAGVYFTDKDMTGKEQFHGTLHQCLLWRHC